MKVFICSIITLIILGILVTLNALTVCSLTENLIYEAKNLPEEPDRASSDRLISLWYKYEEIFNLTINHAVTDQIELYLNDIKNATDVNAYIAKKSSLLILLTDMKRSASLALDRII